MTTKGTILSFYDEQTMKMDRTGWQAQIATLTFIRQNMMKRDETIQAVSDIISDATKSNDEHQWSIAVNLIQVMRGLYLQNEPVYVSAIRNINPKDAPIDHLRQVMKEQLSY